MDKESLFWPSEWRDPSARREEKPRRHGLTMVIDKGLGIHQCEDLINVAAAYIDVYKLGFGTLALYPLPILQRKISLARQNQIDIMPGGTFFEIACHQGEVERYVSRICALGCNAVEISDGTLPISPQLRRQAISLAREAGLTVYSEYGKKAADFVADKESLLQALEADLAAGASYVIVEARESGNVGVFDKQGKVDATFLREVQLAAGSLAEKLIWEAPQKHQQVSLLQTLGFQVNLGNIAPTDILSVESLRRGLRGDTLAAVMAERARTCW